MNITKKEILKIIQDEINFHKIRKCPYGKKWKSGFIKGLMQIKIVFKNMPTK